MGGVNHKVINEPYGFIYITTNLINGKRYLGQKKFDRKWKEYLGSGKIFKNAVKKYGKDNFKRNIVYICSSAEELNKIEYDLSLFFNVVESPDWYNMVFGGGTTSGIKVTEDVRKKLSAARKKNTIEHPEYDEHHSKQMKKFYQNNPNSRVEVSERSKLLWNDLDYRNKIQKSIKAYWSDDSVREKHGEKIKITWNDLSVREARLSGIKDWASNPIYHDARSKISKQNWEKPGYREEQIRRNTGNGNPMYGVHRFGIDSPRFKPIYCIELNEIFWGAIEAKEKYGINKADIARCCKGILKSAGKHPDTKESLHWKYVEDQTQKDGTIIQGAITLGYIKHEDLYNYLNKLKDKGEV